MEDGVGEHPYTFEAIEQIGSDRYLKVQNNDLWQAYDLVQKSCLDIPGAKDIRTATSGNLVFIYHDYHRQYLLDKIPETRQDLSTFKITFTDITDINYGCNFIKSKLDNSSLSEAVQKLLLTFLDHSTLGQITENVIQTLATLKEVDLVNCTSLGGHVFNSIMQRCIKFPNQIGYVLPEFVKLCNKLISTDSDILNSLSPYFSCASIFL